MQAIEAKSIEEKVKLLPWFHQIDLGALITPGVSEIGQLRSQADIYFRDGMAGKSVLDVGCWDGFNSFAAEKAGASRVLATDHYAWSECCWGDRRSIELAKEVLGSKIEIRDIDLADIAPQTVGSFDVVLFLGVFYHLRNPFLALENIAKVCKETLVIETHLDGLDVKRPAMIFYPGTELDGDNSNWWGPNPACVLEMVKDLGFIGEHFDHPTMGTRRGIFIARRHGAL